MRVLYDALDVLQCERGYVTANALRMQYPVFRKRGLPVANGAVEGGAKHLVQQRMKRAASASRNGRPARRRSSGESVASSMASVELLRSSDARQTCTA